MARTSLAEIFRSVSIFTDSEWQRNTGTRTVVAVTPMESSSSIFWSRHHLHLFLGVAVLEESIDMRQTIERDLVRIHLRLDISEVQ